MRYRWKTGTRKQLVRRTVAVSIAALLVAVGVWYYAFTAIHETKAETYEGKIRLTSMTIEEAKHLKHKFRVRRVKRRYIKVGNLNNAPTTRRVGHCSTETAHNAAGHRLLMNVLEVWAQYHWCNKRSNPTQIAKANVTATRTDTCCLLNPWEIQDVTTMGSRYWDGIAYSEIAQKVTYFKFQQKIGPLGLFHKTMYLDCRLNALHGWFRCHMGFGETAPAWTPSW